MAAVSAGGCGTAWSAPGRPRSKSSSSGRRRPRARPQGRASGIAAKPGKGGWTGAGVAHLGELCAALAVVTFEPGSHVLVTGGGEASADACWIGACSTWNRTSCRLWRRYARALKQRNALLKARRRRRRARRLGTRAGRRRRTDDPSSPALPGTIAAAPAGRGGGPAAGRGRGEHWSSSRAGGATRLSLADALLLARDRDRAAGFTSIGPHRADWRIDYAAIPGREALSRGQAKLTALAILLAQAELHADLRGEWPVVALDDLASELDRTHQRRVLATAPRQRRAGVHHRHRGASGIAN